MSQENVELVKEVMEAFLRRDATTIEHLMDPEIEWDTIRIAGVVPDLAGVYRGTEGARALWRAWLSP
jgi:hypothetical protein